MDSAKCDSDDEIVISESSCSEDSFNDFSDNIVQEAHSTMRPSSLLELIEDCSKENADSGSISISEEESENVESENHDEESIVKVKGGPTSRRKVMRIESSDEEESISEVDSKSSSSKSENAASGSTLFNEVSGDKKASLKELEDSLGKVHITSASGIESDLKSSVCLSDPRDSRKRISVTGIESNKKESIDAGMKDLEDSLEHVTFVNASDIGDYTNGVTRICSLPQHSVIKSAAVGMKVSTESVMSEPSALGKIEEASRVSYRTVTVVDSDSSSDENQSNSSDFEVEKRSIQSVNDDSDCEIVETIKEAGIEKERKKIEATVSTLEKKTKESHAERDLSNELRKVNGEIFVQSEFQNAGNLLRTENEAAEERTLPQVADTKNEFKKLEENRKLPSEKQLRAEIDSLQKDVSKLKMTLMSIDVSKLPDRGARLRLKLQESENLLKQKQKAVAEKEFVEDEVDVVESVRVKPPAPHRLPIGFGMQALKTQIREKTLTEETLQQLHGSINSCPAENVFADDPHSLRSGVQLMSHQKHALAWLMWREKQRPAGGILADDMGLGKTLTMIALILKCTEDGLDENDKERNGDNNDDEEDNDDESSGGNWLSKSTKKRPQGGSLVICPASLIMQWEAEIKKHCKRDSLTVEIHHGSKREDVASRLARNDIVITTYSIIRNSGGKADRGVLHQIIWRRIILDEAHVVRNHKSQQSMAVCSLRGKKRWALTGTPVHNKELDLYALMKFLRVSPFDDYNVWHRWVDSKSASGLQRLNTVIQAIMLRRTKEILQSKGELQSLPGKKTEEFLVRLSDEECKVYSKVLAFSKTLFAQFLHQRAEKERMMSGNFFYPVAASRKKFQVDENLLQTHPELANMFKKMSQMRDIKTHQILVLLLRLRQICCHPGLIQAMLDDETKDTDGIEDRDGLDIDILAQFQGMTLKESSEDNSEGNKHDDVQINVMTSSNPVFDLKRISSKMQKVFDVLDEKVLRTDDKAVIVSQWTSMLNIIYDHLKERGVRCQILSGAVKVADRMGIVNDFNREGRGFQVLLLSLTAGGVGLNLIGGNHLFMIDLHWNPQLECQAFDRIYRVGQKKNVFIYKFVCEETIEQRIKALQESKLALASSVLSGSLKKGSSKLTLQDLRSLFSV